MHASTSTLSSLQQHKEAANARHACAAVMNRQQQCQDMPADSEDHRAGNQGASNTCGRDCQAAAAWRSN